MELKCSKHCNDLWIVDLYIAMKSLVLVACRRIIVSVLLMRRLAMVIVVVSRYLHQPIAH